MKIKKKSYIYKLFIVMQCLFIILAIFMGSMIGGYARKAVGKEILKLNGDILKETAEKCAWVIADGLALSKELAYDNKVIEFLSLPQTETARMQELSEDIEKKIQGSLWIDFNKKRYYEVYGVSYQGTEFATYGQAGEVVDLAFLDSLSFEEGPILLQTQEMKQNVGIQKYAFKMVSEVRDHLTDEKYGYVILSVSELALFDTYKELLKGGRTFQIVNEEGIVLSTKNKSEIGTYFADENEQFIQKNQQIYSKGKEQALLYQNITQTNWYFVEQVSFAALFQALGKVRLFIIGMVVVVSLGISMLFKYFYKQISDPILEIQSHMEQVAGGNLEIAIPIRRKDEFGEIAKVFNFMVEEIQILLKEVREGEKKKRLADLDFLRAQMNPHFIYNTLSSIRFYVEMNKTEEAENMLYHFSILLRRTLSKSKEFVTLQEEIHLIRQYAALQALRYKDQFEIHYEIEEGVSTCLVPNFILQPIVENAIFYGIAKGCTNHIQIKAYQEVDVLWICVADEGVGMSEAKIQDLLYKDVGMNHVGLKNVEERIKLNYGQAYGINIESKAHEGTKVYLRVPIQKG